MLSDAGHCVPWMQTVRAALLPNEQQITPESVWQTEIFERKVKENEEKSDGNRGEAQRKRGKKKGARDVLHGLRGHNAKGFAGSGGTDFNAKI